MFEQPDLCEVPQDKIFPLTGEEQGLIGTGKEIQACKKIKERTGCCLLCAKKAVDTIKKLL